jgi:DNA-binding FadR family transcriptional regulator
MKTDNIFSEKQQKFLEYLAAAKLSGKNQIPALAVIGKELGVSNSSLREILELAKTLGLVEAHPRSGIELLKYSFKPTVIKSLGYALMENKARFEDYSDLRIHLEKAYFLQAARLLNPENIDEMKKLVIKAKDKLNRTPIQIPHPEHRQLHLSIYRNIKNDFVTGLLEAYWTLYENVGLDLYTDLSYLVNVWNYHENIVKEIAAGNFEQSHHLLIEHMELIKSIQPGK